MGFFDRLFHGDGWCRRCRRQMEQTNRQLFALPDMTVGHYREHTDPEYFRRNLRRVNRKADIPPGMYACAAIQYRCPKCGRHFTKLDVFLPVRDQEKHEPGLIFDNGELDQFLWG